MSTFLSDYQPIRPEAGAQQPAPGPDTDADDPDAFLSGD